MPRLSCLLLALCAAPLAAHAAPVYTVAPIGAGSLTSQPNGLNNAGTVVGYTYTAGGHTTVPALFRPFGWLVRLPAPIGATV